MRSMILFFTFLIVGCSNQTTATLAGAALSDNEVALVSTEQDYPKKLSSVKLTKIDGTSVASREMKTGEIRLTPGRYILTYYVMNERSNAGWKYAYVETPKRVIAGERYIPRVRIYESTAEVWLEKQ